MDARLEKSGLLALAAGATIALTWIALKSLGVPQLDPNAATLIGVIVGGLIALSKDVIQAIRGYAMSAQLGKVTDQLAASGPPPDTSAPQPVEVINRPDNPVPTTQEGLK